MRSLYAYDIVDDLKARGWARVSTEPTTEALTAAAIAAGTLLGATTAGVKVLNGDGDTQWLPRHTENLTDPTPLRYFALGCIQPAASGGATVLYDGQAAADALLQKNPQLAGVRITYATVYRPATATHPLISTVDGASVLRFRSKLPTNAVRGSLPEGMSEADIYEAVEATVSEALVLAYAWRPGDLLIVDNARLVHARAPYSGIRVMARYRYDDPHFTTVMINE